MGGNKYRIEISPATKTLGPITMSRKFLSLEKSDFLIHRTYFRCIVARHTSPFHLANLFGKADVASLRVERRLISICPQVQWIVYRWGKWCRTIVFWAFSAAYRLRLPGIDYESRSSISFGHG
jgi:hypothetical protein